MSSPPYQSGSFSSMLISQHFSKDTTMSIRFLFVAFLISLFTTSSFSQENAAPPMPKGFASTDAVKAAILSGSVKIIQAENVPIPDNVTMMKDVEFGKGGDKSLLLDLYLPKDSKEPKPGLIFIHGGAWKGGSKEVYAYYCVKFAAKGYAVATISYRKSQEAPFPAALEDSKCAVRWMRAHAKEYGIDTNRIAVLGGSAGGHLSMMVGYTPGKMEGSGGYADQSSAVQVVVDLYGPSDLTTDDAKNAGSVKAFMGGKTYDEAKELYEQASPNTHITKNAPPTLILHGTIDDTVQIIQADMLEAKLKVNGVPYHYEKFPGWPHTMDLAQSVNDRCFYLMEQFFAKHLVSK